MGQERKAPRRQATAQHRRGTRRLTWLMVVPGVIAALVAVIILTRQPGYSGFEVIGTQPAVVFVFLPG